MNFTIDRIQLLNLLKNLIQINSVNPALSGKNTGELEIATFIGKYLKHLGIEVIFQPIGDRRINVIGILKGQGRGKTLMLNGHTDTVGTDHMEIKPFYPREAEGKVYGRGALDMKSGIAAQIIAVETLIRNGINLEGNIILSFVADEEHESLGTEALLKEFQADAAIICEPTHLDVVIAHKGFAWITIEVFGNVVNGSWPNEGVDAIIKAGQLLTAIAELGNRILMRKKHHLLGSPSIHASVINGGRVLNSNPDNCLIELERRTLPGETDAIIAREIEGIIKKIKARDAQFNATYEIFFSRPPFEISPDAPIVKTICNAYTQVQQKNPVLGSMGGWIESALLAAANIPTVIFGPKGHGLHAAVEWVDFDSVVTTAEILMKTIMDFCKMNRSKTKKAP